jgi:gamma-glutamylcyclotransferase (GGCT)/AIG2-like uncharacterized protein YtfP
VRPLFAYGTLLDESFTSNLLERPVRSEAARLLDFEFQCLEGLGYLTAVYAPGESIEGRLYRDLSEEDYTRLDFYEGVKEGLYKRVEAVIVAGEKNAKRAPETALVYVPTEKTLRRYGAQKK